MGIVGADARVKSATLPEISANVGGRVLYCDDTEYDIIEAIIAGGIPVGLAGGYRTGVDLMKADTLVVIDDFAEIAEALMSTIVLRK